MHDDWKFGHPGIWVRDFDKTMDYYRSLGIAGRIGLTLTAEGMDGALRREFGKVAPPPDLSGGYALDLLVIGDLMLEVLQLLPRKPSITGDYLVPGEGVNHVCFNVPDIVGDSLKLSEKGPQFMLVLRSRKDDNLVENYLDTRESGNIILSLRPDPDGKRSEGETATKAGLATNDWKFRGHSVADFDVEKAVEYYEFLELASPQSGAMFDSESIKDFKAYGETSGTAVKAKTRTVRTGPTEFEFVQPVEGESIFKEIAAVRGEGIFDLTFTVNDLDKETAKLVDKGAPVILSGTPQTGGAFAFFDTRKDGGDVLIKLVQAE